MPRCQRCGSRGCRSVRSAALEEHAPISVDGALMERAGYRVARALGSGGFGTVVAAAGLRGGEEVAIKLARRDRPDAGARLAREAEALWAVGPPHVPRLHRIDRLEDGTSFLVMELLRAPTLAERLAARSGPLAPEEARAAAIPLLEALDAVHARGFVHLDLKPENVFVGPAARLTDFGLARRANEDGVAASEITAEGSLLGTPEYMSPEQCRGREVDARADIYAMGVILYEMLVGRPPFWGSPAEVQQRHLCRRPARPSEAAGLPPEIDEPILRCLAKEPSERFGSAADLASAIDPVLRAAVGAEATTRPTPSSSSPRPAPARERRTVALLSFGAEAEVSRIQEALAPLGGSLAHAAAGRFVAAFDHDAGDNPARRALGAARALLAGGVSARVRADLASVSVQQRADGARRYQSPLFTRDETFPGAGDPHGVLAGRALAALLPEARWAEVPGLPDLLRLDAEDGEAPGLRRSLRAEPTVGRDEILGQLVGAAARAVRERSPTAAVVLADAGLGKTHLARALSEVLRRSLPEAEIVELRALEPAGGGPDRTPRELLRWALDLPAAAPPDQGRGLLHERLGAGAARRLWPGVALVLGWADPDDTAVCKLSAAPGALRAAAARAAGEALLRRAALGPLVVLLDDAHLADEITLDALEIAAQADAARPIFVAALGRPAFEAARPAWGARAAVREEIRLGPLSTEAAAALCRALLWPVKEVPARAIERLVDLAQAIPLFLVELIRSLKRGGAVRRHARGDAYYLVADELDRLPGLPLVEWLAQRELASLPPDLAAHARLSSLLGPEHTAAEVAGVLRVLERKGEAAELRLDALVGVRQLVAAGILVLRRPSHLAFRHALVREAIARTVPPDLRVRWHRAAFTFHREARGAPDEGRLAQLAHHAEGAGLPDVARDTYLALAERARERHAYLDAGALYTSALAQPGEAASIFYQRALRGRGLVRCRIGRYDDALADLGRAREHAAGHGDAEGEAAIRLDEATIRDWMERSASR